MSKNSDPVDIKKEKDKFIALLTAETKRYDIQGISVDLNNKIDQYVG